MLCTEYSLKRNHVLFLLFSNYKRLVYLESHRGRRLSGRRKGLRKQVTAATEGPLELGGEEGDGNVPGGRGRGTARACTREGEGEMFLNLDLVYVYWKKETKIH